MAGYVKLFGSILDSTVWRLPPAIKVVWVTMLAMADRDGVVEASVPGIAHRAQVPLRVAEKAIGIFLAPDPHSKTPDKEGRRIESIPRGWKLINHGLYREMGRTEYNPDNGTPTLTTRGRVYFIRCADAIKIGFSQNPWARLNTLKTAMPGDPVLLGHFAGTIADERAVQERFEALRVNREWFRVDTALLSFIQEKCAVSGLVATGSDQGSDARTTSDLICATSGSQGSPENPAAARSNREARIWQAFEWCRRYGAAWCEKYKQIAYGDAGDGKAHGTLTDILERLPESERLAAQREAPRMFAEFLGRGGREAQRRHPFVFFVQEFGGLRVPQQQDKQAAAGPAYQALR